jgi:tryptophan synthase alpha chain
MSRIASTLSKLHAQGRKALIPYVTAGFPYADITPELMHAFVQAGSDIIELGVPFSDPMADGPVIQRAGEQALTFGIGWATPIRSSVTTSNTAPTPLPAMPQQRVSMAC